MCVLPSLYGLLRWRPMCSSSRRSWKFVGDRGAGQVSAEAFEAITVTSANLNVA